MDLNDVVRRSVSVVMTQMSMNHVDLSFDLAADLPLVQADANQIEQVVVNLVLNACQALADMDRGIQVATTFDPQRGEVKLTVKDEGVGIPAEHLAHLTDPFFTTRRASGGTGLGLSVSAGIVKDHRGKLEFLSAAGAGTTAVMTLPAMKGI